jgi:hypothetical protein
VGVAHVLDAYFSHVLVDLIRQKSARLPPDKMTTVRKTDDLGLQRPSSKNLPKNLKKYFSVFTQ